MLLSSSPPPFGVIIPTKNSRAYLPAHLAGLKPWLDLAREVVVVDSFSTDGTLDYLKEHLSHPRITFASHPPGLYASWNQGIAQIQSTYVMIATSGDLITRSGLERLLHTAETLACDVVISKPSFRDVNDRPLPDIPWPIDDIIDTLGLSAPRKLTKLEAVIFAVVHASGALLGSSASNIYRTEILKRFPFPTDFGTSGDGAWGLQHAAEAVWGVVPGKFSSFLVHSSGGSDAEKKSYRESRRGDAVLGAAMKSWRSSGLISDEELACARWHDLMNWLVSWLDAKAVFDRDRRKRFPWLVRPKAWKNRLKRERSARRLHEIKRQALAAVAQSKL